MVFLRHNRKQRKIEDGIALKKKGRPQKSDKIMRTDKINDLKYIIARKDAKSRLSKWRTSLCGIFSAYRKEVRAEVKFRVIYRHKDKYSVSEMCRFFEVSRSGYYGFVKRMDRPAKYLELSELIRECQAETKQTYGYRRVAIWLERKGIHHDPKTLMRVMNKYSLLSVVRRRQYCNYSQALHRYDDLPNMDFMLTDQIRSGLPKFPA